MSGILRVLLIIRAIVMLVFMLNKIRQSKMKIEYIGFWIAFASVLVIMGVFPEVFYLISKLLGFQSPISMVYLIIIFILIMKLFFMTIQVSQLENKIDSLVQETAIDRKMDIDKNRTKEQRGALE